MSLHKLVKQYQDAIQVTIDKARLVVIFDGTDRNSIDELREALLRLGEITIQLDELTTDCD